MAKSKVVVVLAKLLSPIFFRLENFLYAVNILENESSTRLEWRVRDEVTNEIIKAFKQSNLTVACFALSTGTSRGRITRILKNDTSDISLDVLFRVLGALGRGVQMKFKKGA